MATRGLDEKERKNRENPEIELCPPRTLTQLMYLKGKPAMTPVEPR